MSVFKQKLNYLSEDQHVEECEDENYDQEQEIARSSFADMLHDHERNQMYFDALKLAIDKTHLLGKKAKVLDIGTGTGLLSMMAVRCGADSVIACEACAPISDCARRVVALNGFGDAIKIVSKHSKDLTVGKDGDLPEKANILVTEVFDTELIGEGALGTFKHAHEKLLEKDCIVIPDSGMIYAQVVATPYADNWNRFKNVYNAEGELLILTSPAIRECEGTAAVHDIQLSQFPRNYFKELVPPQPVLFFDWSGRTALEDKRCNVTEVKCSKSGQAQAVFVWWELYMDVEKTIVLSCAPYWAHPSKKESSEIPWRDHWMQAVYYLPVSWDVVENLSWTLYSCHDEFSLWFYLSGYPLNAKEQAKPICKCGLHIAHSRTRIGQLNDNLRIMRYLCVIEQYVSRDSVVLLLGDGFYCGLAASVIGAKVLYLSDTTLSTNVVKLLKKCNRTSTLEIVKNMDDLKKHPSLSDVNLILSELHFSTTILPWDGLHFAYLLKELKSFVSENCLVAPVAFSIKGIAVQFTDLQKIHQPLGRCFDFDMQPFDDLINNARNKCDAGVEAQPLWEYPCIARSSVVEITNLNLESMFDVDLISVEREFLLDCPSQCNGIALWVEWDLDGSADNVICTGPSTPPIVGNKIQWDMHTRQGVHFLEPSDKPTKQCKFVLNVQEGTYKFDFS